MVVSCRQCGGPIASGNRYCPECGNPAETATQATEVRRVERSSSKASAGTFTAGQILASRYRIIERVGGGGMGEVYHADDLTLEQPVALKFLPDQVSLSPHANKRFRDEVRVARQLSHPNVCRVHDIGEVEGLAFISMEFIRGEDLRSLLSRIGRLSPEKAGHIAAQIASGLAAAHKKGVLHRDMKPANVMLDERGDVRIMDFGLAAVAEDVETHDIQSGTPSYMAPEQLAGRAVTTQSDLYSLGLVLYEVHTGKKAFAPEAQGEDGRPLPPRHFVEGLDPSIERIILQRLEPDSAKRHVPRSRCGTPYPVEIVSLRPSRAEKRRRPRSWPKRETSQDCLHRWPGLVSAPPSSPSPAYCGSWRRLDSTQSCRFRSRPRR